MAQVFQQVQQRDVRAPGWASISTAPAAPTRIWGHAAVDFRASPQDFDQTFEPEDAMRADVRLPVPA
eukprot:417743-Pyramimonas_sp.AAC.1